MLDEVGTFEDTVVIPRLWTMDLSGNVRIIDDWMVYATWNNVTNVQAVTSWRPFGARPDNTQFCILGCETRTVKIA